jgi:arginine decarboxylase
MPVAVDEAHGAHLSFNYSLPKSSMQVGADICVQSAHKTLPALTQCSYLHVKDSRIDRDRLEYYIRIFQTTSPSYILMASLDSARALMQQQGKQLLDKLLKTLDTARTSLSDINGINVIKKKDMDNCLLDETRLVINSKKAGITGYEMEKLLRRNFNIQVEMSDYYNIVCITTVADTEADFEKLILSVRECAAKFSNKSLPDIAFASASIPVQSLELKDIPHCSGEYVDIKSAVNRTSIDSVTPYPPGIPVICPGEIINSDSINIILDIKRAGGSINGLTEDNRIWVVK